MTWPIVVLVLGVLFIGCTFAAIHRFLATRSGPNTRQLETRFRALEEEFHKIERAITAGPSPIRKAGY